MPVVSVVVIFSSFIFFCSYVWTDGTLPILSILMLVAAAVFGALQSTGSLSTVLLLWQS